MPFWTFPNANVRTIFVLDRENLKILDANPSAEETYGYYKEELIGRSFEDLGTFE
ncbi:MAG: PAS domain S-box protein, partial [Deltaproteobacteria bacterium]|nr:PAS domain S-box protein [Deltaproteobacteria bacterium]